MQKNIITTPYYRGFEIQASESLPCRKDILDGIYEVFSKTIFRRSTNFMHFAVTFPRNRQYPLDNNLFMGFLDSFMKHLRCKNLKPCLLWVREHDIGSGPNQYYHFILCLSGREADSTHGHLVKAVELWELALGIQPGDGRGLIREYNDGVINYGDIKAASKYFYDASGLSNTKNKEYLPGIKTAGRSLF